MALDALGLDKDSLIHFIGSQKPNYPQFEAYVREHATKLNQTAVSQLNAAIAGYQHDEKTRKAILEAVGLPDGHPTDAINLNNLDDWHAFYGAELADN